MAIFDVTIVRTSEGSKVVPPYTVLQAGDNVKFRNRTGSHVIVFFPHDKVFGAAGAHFHHKLDPGAANDHTPPQVVVAPGAGAPRNFPFVVYSDETRSFAEGNSDPEIIIE